MWSVLWVYFERKIRKRFMIPSPKKCPFLFNKKTFKGPAKILINIFTVKWRIFPKSNETFRNRPSLGADKAARHFQFWCYSYQIKCRYFQIKEKLSPNSSNQFGKTRNSSLNRDKVSRARSPHHNTENIVTNSICRQSI